MANRWICLADKEIDLIRAGLLLTGRMKADEVVAPGPDMEKRCKAAYREVKGVLKKLDKTQKRITVASAKGKGRELQQWVCRKISALIRVDYNQQSDDSLIRSREMGQPGVDIILRGRAAECFPFAIECKSTEETSWAAFVLQAQQNQVGGRHWMVVVRSKTLRDPVVIMDWDVMELMFKGVYRLKFDGTPNEN